MKALHTSIIPAAAVFAVTALSADWVVVDRFEDPDLPGWVAYLPDPDEPRRVDPNDPPRLEVVPDPFGGTGNALAVYPGRLVELTSNMFASLELPAEARIVDPFPEETLATLYFRVARPLVGNRPAEVDTVWGLSPVFIDEMGNPRFDDEGNLVRPTTYGQFSVQARYELDGIMDVRDESEGVRRYVDLESTAHATDTWYELWYVIDHANNRFSKYIRGGPEYPAAEPVLLYPFNENDDWAQYRLGTFEDLAFFTIATTTGSISDGAKGVDPTYFADIHIDPTGMNLSAPGTAVPVNPFAALAANAWVDIAPTGAHFGFQDGAGWSYHDGLGFLESSAFPWLWHPQFGWLAYMHGDFTAGGMFLLSPESGWVYASAANAGQLLVFSDGAWTAL